MKQSQIIQDKNGTVRILQCKNSKTFNNDNINIDDVNNDAVNNDDVNNDAVNTEHVNNVAPKIYTCPTEIPYKNYSDNVVVISEPLNNDDVNNEHVNTELVNTELVNTELVNTEPVNIDAGLAGAVNMDCVNIASDCKKISEIEHEY